MSTNIFIQTVIIMKKTLSILLCLAFMLVSFTACSSNAMTEKNVTKTVDTAFAALKEFDTDTLQKYVDSTTRRLCRKARAIKTARPSYF